jgi:hypothetical protein
VITVPWVLQPKKIHGRISINQANRAACNRYLVRSLCLPLSPRQQHLCTRFPSRDLFLIMLSHHWFLRRLRFPGDRLRGGYRTNRIFWGANFEELPQQRPKTILQSGIRKEKVYTDGAIKYRCFFSIGEPDNITEVLDDKN